MNDDDVFSIANFNSPFIQSHVYNRSTANLMQNSTLGFPLEDGLKMYSLGHPFSEAMRSLSRRHYLVMMPLITQQAWSEVLPLKVSILYIGYRPQKHHPCSWSESAGI